MEILTGNYETDRRGTQPTLGESLGWVPGGRSPPIGLVLKNGYRSEGKGWQEALRPGMWWTKHFGVAAAQSRWGCRVVRNFTREV